VIEKFKYQTSTKMKNLVFVFLCTFIIPQFVCAQVETDFYDSGKIAEIRIKFKKKDWAEQMDSLRIYGDDLLLGTATIDGKEYKNIGVRYRGSRSFAVGSKRNALHIKLNYINKNQNHQGYKKIKISNALRDPSMVREVLGYEIARKYMPAPKANYAKVYVNDSYYGLFVNVEDISEEFLMKHFGSDENAFFKCSPDITKKSEEGCKNKTFASLEYEEGAECYFANYEMKSEHGWDDLIELTKVLEKNPEKIDRILNVDRTLWMLAFNNVLVNLSSYSGQNSQNYYLYKDDNGHFNPIIWDLNLAFGSFKNTGMGSDLDLKGLQTLDPLNNVDNVAKPLISKLLSDPERQKLYLSHVRTILYENFVSGIYEDRAKELQRLINVPFYEDKNRFYDPSEYEKSLTTTIGKRSKIPGIVELMSARASFLKKHPKLSVVPVEISNIKVKGRQKLSKDLVKDFNISCMVANYPKQVKVMYRFDKNNSYKSAVMTDDGNSDDGVAGDKMYGVKVSPPANIKEIEFYIMAENPKSISFEPSNYMFKTIEADLDTLNK